jgi:hypothetical protein
MDVASGADFRGEARLTGDTRGAGMALRGYWVTARHARIVVGTGVARTASLPDSDLHAATEEQPMKDITIRVGGTAAETSADLVGNVVPLGRRIGRTVAAELPTGRSPATSTSENGALFSEAAAAVPEESAA